jgi:hypothetical protein
MYQYSSQRPGEVITTDVTDGFIINNFRLLSVPNEIPDLPNEKSFPNSMCAVMVKRMGDIKQAMEYYINHDHQDFWTSILAWDTTIKEDQEE